MQIASVITPLFNAVMYYRRQLTARLQ